MVHRKDCVVHAWAGGFVAGGGLLDGKSSALAVLGTLEMISFISNVSIAFYINKLKNQEY